jgi:hypothetical protein
MNTEISDAASASQLGQNGTGQLATKLQHVNLNAEFKRQRQWKFDPKRLTDREFKSWYLQCLSKFVMNNKGVDTVTMNKYGNGLDHRDRCKRMFGSYEKALMAAHIRKTPQGMYYTLPRGGNTNRQIKQRTGYKGHNMVENSSWTWNESDWDRPNPGVNE